MYRYGKPKGKVGVSMIKYVDKVLEGFLEDLGASAATPAAEHLFQLRNDSEAEILSEMKAQEFHHITAQLLFLSARARRDIQVDVAFLTTRVKKPDVDDWGKLRRVLNSFPSKWVHGRSKNKYEQVERGHKKY